MSLVGQYLRLREADQRLGVRHTDLRPETLKALDDFDRHNAGYRIIGVRVGLSLMLGAGYIKGEGDVWRKETLTVLAGTPDLNIMGMQDGYTTYMVTFKSAGDAVAWTLDGIGIDTRTGEKRPVHLRFVLLACLTDGTPTSK
jgi:hypothetical protein